MNSSTETSLDSTFASAQPLPATAREMPRSMAAGESILRIKGFRTAVPLDQHADRWHEKGIMHAPHLNACLPQGANIAKESASFRAENSHVSSTSQQRPRKKWLPAPGRAKPGHRSEEHTSELQSLMRISYAAFCLKKKNKTTT